MTRTYKICLLGGTGFVGFHLIHYLAEAGHAVKVLARHRERHRNILVLPRVEVIEADVHAPGVLDEHFTGCDAVINLVGILNQRKRRGETFETVHVALPRHIVQACRHNGVSRLLHMSALHADAAAGPSEYLRTKGEGEDIAHGAAEYGIHVTSFRPSIIFGPGDHFFNRFARLLRRVPLMLPLACPETPYAPIFVEDVAQAFTRALLNRHAFGQRYELCGPRRYTLRQLVEYTAQVIGRRTLIVGLGDKLSRLQARLLTYAPGQPLTYDNYLSMRAGGTCGGMFPAVFELTPTAVEAVVPYFLRHLNERAQRYHAYRRAGRQE
jgi:nucleoside-diphosphate-sugar epimerase